MNPTCWPWWVPPAALEISDIPFAGPIAGVKVGRIDGQFIANPTIEQMEQSDIELVVAGSRTGVVMVEGGANIVSEAGNAGCHLFRA